MQLFIVNGRRETLHCTVLTNLSYELISYRRILEKRLFPLQNRKGITFVTILFFFNIVNISKKKKKPFRCQKKTLKAETYRLTRISNPFTYYISLENYKCTSRCRYNNGTHDKIILFLPLLLYSLFFFFKGGTNDSPPINLHKETHGQMFDPLYGKIKRSPTPYGIYF